MTKRIPFAKAEGTEITHGSKSRSRLSKPEILLRLHESLQHWNLLDKLVHNFRARDFAGFFEKSLNERANLGALQACGL